MSIKVLKPTVTDLRAVTTCSITEAGAFLDRSAASAYRCAADGSIPTIQVGRTRRVPTPRLLAMVGLDWEVSSEPPSGNAQRDQ